MKGLITIHVTFADVTDHIDLRQRARRWVKDNLTDPVGVLSDPDVEFQLRHIVDRGPPKTLDIGGF